MPTAEYMHEYRKRPGVRERERREKRWYDLFHQDENRARWKRRNETRKVAKAAWYQSSANRIAKDRKTRRDYVARFGRKPKGYIFTIVDMAKALSTGHDPFADLRASWKRGAKDRAKRAAATRKQNKAARAIWNAYNERFGEFGWLTNSTLRLMRKSLKDGIDHLIEERAKADARMQENKAGHDEIMEAIKREAERQGKVSSGPFAAKDERAITKLIKNRKLFEGACELPWPEYFEYREANKCPRLTANDLRYAGQYTDDCPAPER
jgi:hypothetical protein